MKPWKQRSIEKVPMMGFISTEIRLHVKIGNEVFFAQFQLEQIRFPPLKNF